jgi:hypothetical protein
MSHPPPSVDRLAPVMFGLAAVMLVTVAGLIHRATERVVTPAEVRLMGLALWVVWPLLAVEAVGAAVRRSPAVKRRTAYLRAALVVVFPPARLAWVHPATDQIWLPRFGWRSPGKQLLKELDKRFGVPMLIAAFLILPVLAVELYQPAWLTDNPRLSLALDVAIAVIWIAFAAELILKASAAPHTRQYLLEKWVDVAIVALPLLEFALASWADAGPLARLVRLSRAVGPKQVAALSKVYRFRGLMAKGWQAFLLLGGVGRLLGGGRKARLAAVEARIALLEEELADLRAEADELRKAGQPGMPS